MHKRQPHQGQTRLPEVVFDCCSKGSEGQEKAVPALVARSRGMQMLFGHVVPRNEWSHEHGAKEPTRDSQKSGQHEVALKCDWEPALSLQEEFNLLREAPTTLRNSGNGHGQSNGAAGKAVHPLWEQVRVETVVVASRLAVKVKGSHPATA